MDAPGPRHRPGESRGVRRGGRPLGRWLPGGRRSTGGDGRRGGPVRAGRPVERDGESWGRRAELRPVDADGDRRFGTAVALDGDGSTTLVGATSDGDIDGAESGTVYVFE
ncbi:hypothetical protein GJ629_08020 [Halapricum sp. CBA1109]|nr:hypothetical protein [Halapricum sp. CBA1109]